MERSFIKGAARSKSRDGGDGLENYKINIQGEYVCVNVDLHVHSGNWQY